jgi:hypothetical protein
MKCTTCGWDNAPNANYCARCRSPLAPAAPPPGSPYAPAPATPPSGTPFAQPPSPASTWPAAPVPGGYVPSPPGAAYPFGAPPAGSGAAITDDGLVRLLAGERPVTQLRAGKSTLYLTTQRVALSFKGYLRVARILDVDSVSAMELRLPLVVALLGLFLAGAGFLGSAASLLGGGGDSRIVGMALPLFVLVVGAGLVLLYWFYTRLGLVLTIAGQPALTVQLGSLGQQRSAEVLAFMDTFYQTQSELEKP